MGMPKEPRSDIPEEDDNRGHVEKLEPEVQSGKPALLETGAHCVPNGPRISYGDCLNCAQSDVP
jgi:hypothetical protein